MMGHNICFKGVIWKIILKFFLLPLLIWSTDTGFSMHISCSRIFSDCFVSDSITEDINGTVRFALRQTTIDFIELYHNFTECIPRNISNVSDL